MSVILYDEDELASVALAATNNADIDSAAMQFMQDALLNVHEANAAAYQATYKDSPDYDAIGLGELRQAIQRQRGRYDFTRACMTAWMLDYNCISNGGRDFAEEMGVEGDLLHVVGRCLSAMLDRQSGMTIHH